VFLSVALREDEEWTWHKTFDCSEKPG
jgi:hypothetical protein